MWMARSAAVRASLTAALGLALLASACGRTEDAPAAPQASAQEGPAAAAQAPTAPGADTDTARLLASLPAPYNTGDYANGKRQFAKCRSCHTIVPGGVVMQGPPLHGVFGRRIASYPDFRYSPALAAADFTWTAEELDKWLTDPRGYLPGNRMSFAGIPDAEDRRDLIAFMKVESTRP
jgi:cytochrome c